MGSSTRPSRHAAMTGIVLLLCAPAARAQETGGHPGAGSHPTSPSAQKAAASRTSNPMSDAGRTWITGVMNRSADVEEQARRLFEAGELASAEQVCLRALATSPTVNGYPFNTSARMLLGDIYLREGRAREALANYLECYRFSGGEVLDLHVTIAYCRLGDLRNAQRYYSDKWLRLCGFGAEPIPAEDLPGTSNVHALAARALFALGIGEFSSSQCYPALAHLVEAESLAPRSAAIAYSIASIHKRLQHLPQALAWLRRAAALGHGPIERYARKEAEGLAYYMAQAAARKRESKP